ncbi:chromate efflux transporter [Shewanella intestini]|uniref:Chromate efflux transporter n=1 Tax=Shewanella intestini TaxID=2017544 RepID=A0ABS5I575_9GAMM|nr:MULTISPECIES: chromate efflux transporter [Shewanella]MBR9729180.1 chromate efflux transporter [Shewanella intestini]MRG37249.1 chromate efflux transporter [Shewanella sp. XMDDZSB0408]
MLYWQIFSRFLALGLISFGGPAAHIGYFRKAFVEDLQWLDDKRYASLVALSQFMPGPGSSQVGFAIGFHRGGLLGALAAFIGFTLPSFMLLFLFAVTSAKWLDLPVVMGIIHGLKLLAVVIVADATLTMFKQFCQRKHAQIIALLTATTLILLPSMLTQIGVLLIAALWGGLQFDSHSKQLDASDTASTREPASIAPNTAPISLNYFWLVCFIAVLVGSIFFVGKDDSLGQIFAQFFQVGSLVFGGGHVVLPLLESSVGDMVSPERFLTGYALAQAIPGPMFALAAFLGADIWLESPILGALVATAAIFLPGFLLMLVGLKSWQAISQRPRIAAAIAGVNAAVVGLLCAALYQPVFTSSVLSSEDMALVLLGFGVLKVFRPHIVLLVAAFAIIGALLTLTLG